MNKILFVFLFFTGLCNNSFSQEQRLADNNVIGWFVYTGTFKVKPKLSIHTEYQWRRVNAVKDWQQSLFRAGINYAIRKDISLNAGYAFVETFPYGDYPNATAFPEHRIFEQVMIANPLGKLTLSHRFTLEQRFVGKVSFLNQQKEVDHVFLNRARYRIRAEIPLHKKTGINNSWSIAFQDELFIGWGKNIGANVFDQNRIALTLGRRISPLIKLEGGYLNQVLQQGKRINNSPVFQYNSGFMIAAHFNFDLTK